TYNYVRNTTGCQCKLFVRNHRNFFCRRKPFLLSRVPTTGMCGKVYSVACGTQSCSSQGLRLPRHGSGSVYIHGALWRDAPWKSSNEANNAHAKGVFMGCCGDSALLLHRNGAGKSPANSSTFLGI